MGLRVRYFHSLFILTDTARFVKVFFKIFSIF